MNNEASRLFFESAFAHRSPSIDAVIEAVEKLLPKVEGFNLAFGTRRIIKEANKLAQQKRLTHIDIHELFFVMATSGDGFVDTVLSKFNILNDVVANLQKDSASMDGPVTDTLLPFSENCQNVLDAAAVLAKAHKREKIGAEYLLLSLMQSRWTHSFWQTALSRTGIELEFLHDALLEILDMPTSLEEEALAQIEQIHRGRFNDHDFGRIVPLTLRAAGRDARLEVPAVIVAMLIQLSKQKGDLDEFSRLLYIFQRSKKIGTKEESTS